MLEKIQHLAEGILPASHARMDWGRRSVAGMEFKGWQKSQSDSLIQSDAGMLASSLQRRCYPCRCHW